MEKNIMLGDSRYLPLKDNSVNCIITSPPYWSLRKYDIPDLIWDGEEGCEHEWVDRPGERNIGRDDGFYGGKTGFGDMDRKQKHPETTQFCLKCSAWRGQLGLEPTIDLYLKHLMQIMDECKRVLRDDGTMWVNLGDSYASQGGPVKNTWKDILGQSDADKKSEAYNQSRKNKEVPEKSLCLIPERFAIEMVNRGWILRNEIIWHKSNCMPSSAKDRFTVDFEPVFFFVKSRKYWFEQQYDKHLRDFSNEGGGWKDGKFKPKNSAWMNDEIMQRGKDLEFHYNPQGRNRRCVWTIPTQPYPESHFATFPEALIEPMIRAGCPKEICEKCGKAREKIIEKGELQDVWHNKTNPTGSKYDGRKEGSARFNDGKFISGWKYENKEIGLTDCGCNAGFRPGVVLDPFAGSGTTMMVAEKLNRIGVGFDLAYGDLQENRMKTIKKGFAFR